MYLLILCIYVFVCLYVHVFYHIHCSREQTKLGNRSHSTCVLRAVNREGKSTLESSCRYLQLWYS